MTSMFCWYVHCHLFSSYFQSAWAKTRKPFCHIRLLHPHFIYQQLSGGSHLSQSTSPSLGKTPGGLRRTRTTVFKVSQPIESGPVTLRETKHKAKPQRDHKPGCWRMRAQNFGSLFSCSDSICLVNDIFEESINLVIKLQGMANLPLPSWASGPSLLICTSFLIWMKHYEAATTGRKAFQPLEQRFLILTMRIRIHIHSASSKRLSIKSSQLSIILMNSRRSEDKTTRLLKCDVWKGHALNCTR